ncbi:MAG TPA: hypothetical protein VMG12_38260 [Polyangiaceae bacterium]|nr:hypothetical protein [Polyangiaceae bacterium]
MMPQTQNLTHGRSSLRTNPRTRPAWHALRCGLGLLAAAAALGLACSDDSDDTPGECIGGDGAVASTGADDHCVGDDGMDIVQAIGMCATGAAPEDEEHEEGEEGEEHEHDEEEMHAILTGREADDDDCKYHVRFENTCVAVNQPVTFTLSLTRKFDGRPGTGTVPENPEVYLESDLTHISPSLGSIRASEGPDGTYEIGPILFDQSGRWVIRFHYFENCSDLPVDSPHGHVAFYIDVP